MTLAQIVDRVRGREGTLVLAGSQVPKFEQSVMHAACRDGTQIINQVHAVDDPDGLLLTEFFALDAGKRLLESYDAYLLHVLSKRQRT
jgi:hypothetical protein